MAHVIRPSEGRRLGLPGRSARELVGGGAERMTVRCVEIAPDAEPGTRRGPHVHADFPEAIYVLAGTGVTECETGSLEVAAGDCVVVPPGELHVTRNTGTGPLQLICFFPVGDIAPGTREFASWEAARAARQSDENARGITS